MRPGDILMLEFLAGEKLLGLKTLKYGD